MLIFEICIVGETNTTDSTATKKNIPKFAIESLPFLLLYSINGVSLRNKHIIIAAQS